MKPRSEKTASLSEKNLFLRYLVWCYKTTKEELDRIDRKFTQLTVDRKLLNSLQARKENFPTEIAPHYQNEIENFKRYIQEKEKSAHSQKFLDKDLKVLQPHYCYLQNRLKAVEDVISELFGKKELGSVQDAYEAEMTRRIWEAREHS